MDGGSWYCIGEDRDQDHPQEIEMQKSKWLSEEALQIAAKRRDVKSKGEKEWYTHLNAEFQRMARRDKKAFLSDQCKEIEENNRIRKTRDLIKKIRDIKGTFHAKMGLIKDRNGMDLAEAEDIKKRWQEYTEELYKKDLNDPDNHDGVITHLEPDILECEVKWALESITTNKASGGDGITVESESEVAQLRPTLCDPMDCSTPGSSVHGILSKNTRVGCHFLLQEIFPTQGLNPGLQHCRQIIYYLCHQGSQIST